MHAKRRCSSSNVVRKALYSKPLLQALTSEGGATRTSSSKVPCAISLTGSTLGCTGARRLMLLALPLPISAGASLTLGFRSPAPGCCRWVLK